MDNNTIVIRGAREHNLRNVDLELPRNRLIVFTGVSGSGKSSLAFDTLYAEGQRRYVESLSSYARQFLGELQKPDVDYLGGLSPSISIQQKAAGRNPRSTVGTITEIYDYLRVLYARIGQGHCPECGNEITAQTREQIINRIFALPNDTRFLVLAPVVRGQKGEYRDLFEDMLKRGFVRARVDGQIVRLTDDLKLDRRIKHHIEIVIDRLKVDAKSRARIAEAVEQALTLGDESLIIAVESESPNGGRKATEARSDSNDILLSARYSCPHCNRSYEPPTPQLFSFNSPQGMCLECDGLGTRFSFDPDLMIPDPAKSFFNGAIPLVGPLRSMGRWRRHIFEGVAAAVGMDVKKPWNKLPEEHRNALLYGTGDRHVVFEWKQRGGVVWKHGGKWEGIIPQLLSSFKKTAAGPRRMQLEKYMRVMRCPSCEGQRLNAQARSVRVGGRTLVEACAMPVGELAEWFGDETKETGRQGNKGTRGLVASLSPLQLTIAGEVLKEIRGRLGFLLNVGLHYLTLDRTAPTLSGGETQRIRLAGQIGCGLVGVLYILDEPSIGLHPRDNDRLLRSLERLRDMGNTVLVVEHDEETMRAADHIVDFGPGPGVRGGNVVASGTFADVVKSKASLTGQYLARAKQIPIPDNRRTPNGKSLKIIGARHNNLKNIDVEIPLRTFVAVTGVSGSGKSSLINDILREGVRIANFGLRIDKEDEPESENGESEEIRNSQSAIRNLQSAIKERCERIDGIEHIDKVIDIDQSPIGRTPRSNPATYIKVFDEIRNLFSQLPEAKIRGYKPGRFSFNKPGGRCEACEGNGSNRLEMDFLADVWVTCPVCEGRRFNRETLQVHFKGRSIRDVLEMDVQEALSHFANVPRISAMLQTLHDVGLDYIKLGQPSPTLSGGEAQRIKLARELCRRSTGKTLYILDEPTTGLHFDDIQKLLRVLHGFVGGGNTVVVIEHNLDVVKTADWIIDLGPDGGSGGGKVVCVGTPEAVAKCKHSYTGQALGGVLGKGTSNAQLSTSNAQRRKKNAKNGAEITHLTVQGAQQHNLKNITVSLPREQMSVFSGPSGSGKSSLALDTIYAEGQRRYIESLSSYARQFLGQLQKPKVEHVSGLSPAISIEQKTSSKSPRSTVGTVTEIYDYLRILYARLGKPHCPACHIPIGTQTADEIIDKIASLPDGKKLFLMAPLERRGQEKYESLWDEIRRTGYVRMRVDGRSYPVESPPTIDHRRKHQLEVVVDRIAVRSGQARTRLADAIEAALDLGQGVMHVAHVEDGRDETEWTVDRYSQHMACDNCGRSFEPLNPHHFSFNSPLGWCPTCEGLGFQRGASTALLIRDPRRSLRDGAIAAWPPLEANNPFTIFAQALAVHVGFSLDEPFEKLTPRTQRAIMHGTGEAWIPLQTTTSSSGRKSAGTGRLKGLTPPAQESALFQYKGLLPAIDEAARVSFVYRHRLANMVTEVACSTCAGSRLRDDAAAYRFLDRTLGEMCDLPLGQVLELFQTLKLSKANQQVAGELLREISNRLRFLVDVGLDYLTLGRAAPTLSGGEAQRIRLASQIGSGLTGVLYVLDEPTIGLHPRDNRRLLRALNNLRDLGNTLVLVEHDREVIAAADYLLDFGPGAGDRGGEITAEGPPKRVTRSAASLTGQYLSGKKAIPVPTNRRLYEKDEEKRRQGDKETTKKTPLLLFSSSPCLVIKGARQNNLKNIDVRFPLGAFVAVSGVSGSGKSSLVFEVLYNTLARKLHRAQTPPAAHDDILGLNHIDKVISVDQTPIGNSPSSNPATYTGVFDLVRELFAKMPEAKVRGYQPKRFSFNKPGGRCEACEGNGLKKIEMHFLPDVWVECDVCHGSRYNPETLAVRYKGRSISDVLNLRVSEALELFVNIPKIRQVLQTLADVGLDYLALGQPAPTLSGGEAQRVKLASELARPTTGRTVYLLDEPTTGLHFDDIHKLLEVLNRLVDLGNTVIVVEHNLDVIKTADWVIDLGPEAGDAGGKIVVEGTPEHVVAEPNGSHTAIALATVLEAGPRVERVKYDPAKAVSAREDDIALEKIGKDAPMPWQIDGRRWHTSERVSLDGKPCHWEGAILDWVDNQVHELGDFAPTDWSERHVVEIGAPKGQRGKTGPNWFFHGLTGQEWLVTLVFRVKRNAFNSSALERSLGIRPLNDSPELGVRVYGNEPRVWAMNHKGPWQSAVMKVHRLREIDTPAFRTFLKEAVASFQSTIQKLQTKPEDLMPWKINGERWHLSDKGFPAGKKLEWDTSLLPRLLAIMHEIEPKLEVRWDNRIAIALKAPGINRAWSQWLTKDVTGLECRFLGKPGQFNLSQVEQFGITPTINGNPGKGDVIRLVFQNESQVQAPKLKALLTEHLCGFRDTFGG